MSDLFRQDKDMKHCKDCLYWRGWEEVKEERPVDGVCRRYPPDKETSVWSSNEICGEYQSKVGDIAF
jgi:hypothetical protein